MRLTLLGARVEVKVSRLNKPGQQPTSVIGKLDSIAKTLGPQRVKIEFALVEKEGGALGLGKVQRSSSARDLGEWSFVFTDMPFPQSPQAESGIMEFCNICMKCSNHCLAGAKGTVLRSWEATRRENSGAF